MKIRMTEDFIFSTKIHVGEIRHRFEVGQIIEAKDISSNGWARVVMSLGGYAFVPYGTFEIIEEPKERTYTESEMKEIRSEWEGAYQNLQSAHNELGAKLVLAEERSESLDAEVRKVNEVADHNFEKFREALGMCEYFEGKSKGLETVVRDLECDLDSVRKCKDWQSKELERRIQESVVMKKKLADLEPQIQRIEEAVRRVVPRNKEGSLAEHVENIVSDYLMIQRAKRNGPKMMRDINAIIAEGERKGEAVFIETEHPEDVYARQEAEFKESDAYKDSFVGRWEQLQRNIADAMRPATDALQSADEALRKLNEMIAKGEAGPFTKIDDREGY